MRRKILHLALLSALCLGAGGALAAPGERGVDARQAHQERRIDRGIANGSLTPGEARRLERGQGHVERIEDRALANDGRLGPAERRHLQHAQNVQSRRIYRLKHDGRGN